MKGFSMSTYIIDYNFVEEEEHSDTHKLAFSRVYEQPDHQEGKGAAQEGHPSNTMWKNQEQEKCKYCKYIHSD